MIKDVLKVYKSVEDLCDGFTEFLQAEVLRSNVDCNISLSGGSTPKVLFDYWSKHKSDVLPWKDMRFFWGDERCVPPDDDMSNYGMTKTHLFNNIEIPFDNIFRIHGENEAQEEANWYSNVLESELLTRNGIPVFDLVILGLGDDGHTVSIFPSQLDLWDNDSNCVVANHPETKMRRVSITGRVVNNAQKVVFLVTGKNKAEKVKQIIADREKFNSIYPAAKVHPRKEEIIWFMDESAASLL